MDSEIFGYRFLSWLATCIVEKIRQHSNLETTQFPPVTGRDTLVSSWCNCHIFTALDARYDPTNSDNLPKSTRYLGAANLKKVNWGKLKLPRNSFYSAMAPHSSTLAWKIPWMEEPGRLQSLGSLRVRLNWATSLSLFTFMHWRRKWQPTPVFLPGESQGRGEPGGLPSMGLHRVRHNWSDLAAATAAEEWQLGECMV